MLHKQLTDLSSFGNKHYLSATVFIFILTLLDPTPSRSYTMTKTMVVTASEEKRKKGIHVRNFILSF